MLCVLSDHKIITKTGIYWLYKTKLKFIANFIKLNGEIQLQFFVQCDVARTWEFVLNFCGRFKLIITIELNSFYLFSSFSVYFFIFRRMEVLDYS